VFLLDGGEGEVNCLTLVLGVVHGHGPQTGWGAHTRTKQARVRESYCQSVQLSTPLEGPVVVRFGSRFGLVGPVSFGPGSFGACPFGHRVRGLGLRRELGLAWRPR